MDISFILQGWNYAPGQLLVRAIDGKAGNRKIQIRMDLGLMQLEWAGRPDGTRPHNFPSLLDYFRAQRRSWEEGEQRTRPFKLTRDDCWALSREAIQYDWRRISFFELKAYPQAEEDAEHNLGILDMCHRFAENEEDRQMSEHYRVFVTHHRIQARALTLLEGENYQSALREIRQGIREIEAVLEEQGNFEDLEDCAELRFLMEWEKEVEASRPLSPKEKLSADLQAAIEQDEFELAASLRDRLRTLESD